MMETPHLKWTLDNLDEALARLRNPRPITAEDRRLLEDYLMAAHGEVCEYLFERLDQ